MNRKISFNEDIKEMIMNWSIDELDELSKFSGKLADFKRNRIRADALEKELKVIEGLSRCHVEYTYNSTYDTETEKVIVKLMFGIDDIDVSITSVDGYTNIETSFGTLSVSKRTLKNTICSVPLIGWILGDSFNLLDTIVDVCMPVNRDSVLGFISGYKKTKKPFDTETLRTGPEVSRTTRLSVFKNVSEFVYDCDDICVDYKIDRASEFCEIHFFKKEKIHNTINLLWDRQYNMYPRIEMSGACQFEIEFIFNLVEKALPVYGKRFVKFLKSDTKKARIALGEEDEDDDD